MKTILLALLVFSSCTAQKIVPQKIVFASSRCYGTCPSYRIQINSDKTARMIIDDYFSKPADRETEDTAKQGCYTGIINDSLFNSIINDMNKVGIDSLVSDDRLCCDAPVKTIIIYSGNKRQFFHTMFPKDKFVSLIKSLYDVYNLTKWEKTYSKFAIEDAEK